MTESAAITALIISYNSAGVIASCVRSIDGAVPVLVVDNASDDDSVERLQACPDVRVLGNDENVGFGRAANIGLAATDSPLVLLLNPDLRIGPADIAILSRAAEQRPRAAILGPALFYPAGAKSRSGYGPPLFTAGHPLFSPLFRRRAQGGDDAPTCGGEPHRVGFLSGCALLLRRSAMVELGGFDEQIFLSFEETDLCLRALLADWELWHVPAATAQHLGGGSTSAVARPRLEELMAWHFEWSRFYLARKWQRTARLPLYLAAQQLRIALSLLWLSLRIALSSALNLLRLRGPSPKLLAKWRKRLASLSGAWAASLGRPASRRLQRAA